MVTPLSVRNQQVVLFQRGELHRQPATTNMLTHFYYNFDSTPVLKLYASDT